MSSYENEAPSGEVADNSYVSRSGHKNEPLNVVSDQERIEDPVDAEADTDEQLGKWLPPGRSFLGPLIHLWYLSRANHYFGAARDDNEAIDRDNILDERTRGAAKPKGAYAEPGDEEGLPSNDGTSSA